MAKGLKKGTYMGLNARAPKPPRVGEAHLHVQLDFLVSKTPLLAWVRLSKTKAQYLAGFIISNILWEQVYGMPVVGGSRASMAFTSKGTTINRVTYPLSR